MRFPLARLLLALGLATAAATNSILPTAQAQPAERCECHQCVVYRYHQAQKDHEQKEDRRPEGGGEPEPQGGYAAGPREGQAAGATSALGFEGAEIEFPSLRIRFPHIKLPALTQYRKPPRMLLESTVAPFVQNFRQEFSMEAGAEPERRPEAGGQPEAGGEGPPQKSFQKAARPHAWHDATAHHGSAGSSGNAANDQIAAILAREQALEQRLDSLQQSIELLVARLEVNSAAPAPVSTTRPPASTAAEDVKRIQHVEVLEEPRLLQRLPEPRVEANWQTLPPTAPARIRPLPMRDGGR